MEYALPSEMGLGSYGWKCIDIFACCNCELYQQQRCRCLWALSMVLGKRTLNTGVCSLHCSLVHSSLWPHQTVGLVTNKHDQTACSRLRYVRGVVGWGLFTSAACRFESVAPPNTKRYFYADCCGVNNSTVLLLRLHFVFQTRGRRPYIPRFSFKTNRRAAGWLVYWWGGGWTLCQLLLCGEADTSTCGSQDLVRSQQCQSEPNAKCNADKGQHWQNGLWICSEGVFEIMNRIQYDSDVSPQGGSSVHFYSFVQPCVMHMWVLPVLWWEAK